MIPPEAGTGSLGVQNCRRGAYILRSSLAREKGSLSMHVAIILLHNDVENVQGSLADFFFFQSLLSPVFNEEKKKRVAGLEIILNRIRRARNRNHFLFNLSLINMLWP